MRLITTHMSADFDAFASAVCAVRLYPGYRILFPGSLEMTVRRFLGETAFPFPEIRMREARRHLLEHVVIVDTHNPKRLGEVWQLIEESGCRVTVIDHHETDASTIKGDETYIRQFGATCTLISSMMREKELQPTPDEASLLLMGIYEDTGGLSFEDTTSSDLREAASLLECGGHLQWVRRWILKGLEPDQLAMLNRLVEGMEELTIRDIPVAITVVEIENYHEEAAYVVHRWMETFQIPVCAAFLVRPPTITMIFRSRLPQVDVSRLAEAFGGGGHPAAASATVSGRLLVELREQLIALLEEDLPQPCTAIDVANRKIFSVVSTVTVRSTKEMINQLKVNALPVRDGDELIGTVTRQILDHAVNHRLGDRPVKAVMHPGVPMRDSATPLTVLRDDFLTGSHRFIIITQNGVPAGLITRMELFRHLFERQSSTGSTLDRRMAGTRPIRQSIARMLREAVPTWVNDVLEEAGRVSAERGDAVYLVGGLVRDLLLERSNEDVDLVVEGDAIGFGDALAVRIGARAHAHEPFKTTVLTLEGGQRVDVVSARTEFYRAPAALPDVITSLIRQDLFRRDFTINALAIALHGDSYGQLIDFFGGRKDLDRREIRVLHSLSFIDDPTRAIRAVRYARRLGFQIASDTTNLIVTAVEEGVFDCLSGQRLLRELELLLAEGHATPALTLLAELGLLAAISPDLQWNEGLRSHLLEVEGQLAWFRLETLGPEPDLLQLFFGAVAHSTGDSTVTALAARLCLSGNARKKFISLPRGISEIRGALRLESRRSALWRVIDDQSSEALLIVMAGLDLTERRRLAEAALIGERVVLPISGKQLVAEGVAPGPAIGRALAQTRDALIDDLITGEQAFTFALDILRDSSS